MTTKNILIAAIAPFLTLFTQFVPSADAQYLSDCNVRVVGQVRGTKVNLRAGAGTEFRSPAYVLVGQYVNMINNSSGNRISREDSEGATWYYIEYEQSGTRGWIREDFLSQQCS